MSFTVIENPEKSGGTESSVPNNVVELTASHIAEWQRLRLITDEFRPDFLEFAKGLPPVSGQKVLCELTLPERAVYASVVTLFDHINEISKELTARTFENMHQAVRRAASPMEFAQQITSGQARLLFDDPEEHAFFIQITMRHAYLFNAFWFMLRTRINNFIDKLSVRAGFKVVSMGPRHDIRGITSDAPHGP